MKNYKYYLLLLILPIGIIFSTTSCKKPDEPYLGTEVIAASGDFTMANFCAVKVGAAATCPVSLTNVGFGFLGGAAEKVYFHCDFSQKVSWTITITGQGSGAVKVITGTTSGLAFNNLESIWTGNASGNRFFQNGETCTAVITFLGSNLTATTTIGLRSTNGAWNYNNDQVTKTSVLDNFDGTFAGGAMAFPYTDQPDGPQNNIYLARAAGNIAPIDGIFMLRFVGEDKNQNTYLGGTGPELLTTHVAAIQKVVPKCETDAAKLYVNLYIYGTGLIYTNLQVRAYELDTINACTDRALNPYPIVYNIAAQANNDQWASDIYINWVGWKMVSIPYSSFKPSTNPAVGGNGNRVKEPRKVTCFNILLQSMPTAGGSVDTYIDYMTVTWGAPFKQ